MGDGMVGRARLLSRELLREDPQRMAHSAGVAHVVGRTATALALPERDLLVAAAWLHDVGYASPAVRRRVHGVDDAVRAEAAGMPPLVVELVAHHSCAVLEARRAGVHDVLRRFAPPPAPLMDVLDHADAVVSKQGLPRTSTIRLWEAVHRHQDDRIRYEALLVALPARERAVRRVEARLAESRRTDPPTPSRR
ncbi:HD domain-containing protein [Amnibacterium endophyticum]|uniref:HD domain-containing protein n=1 Tax=Amnibacterium endophyticum TaxID=2109337 RepID=A0ABW4LDY5_9MICO